ncbi:MAG: ABC transporter substrate-binding protein [Ktedonobacteraceae bacterium]|nr:ABC transporter substrate-binding protein [Ktedonobacteraceae bacterium]MBO0791433.1 ABC transporter substrate-binding protein [Ktedonobacteraceae bacterium]
MVMKRFGLRGLLFLPLMLSLLTMMLSSCGASRGPNELVFWTANTGDIDMSAQKQIVDAFNKANPDLHVTLVGVPGGISNLAPLVTAVRGGTGPDVYFLDRFTVSQFAAIGLLNDLQPYVSKEGQDLSQLYEPFAWQETQFQGHTYALPMDTDARALYYNKDLLSQAGVDPAILDPKNGPISIDTLKQIAFKVNHKDSRGAYDRLGFIPWDNQAFHVTWALDFGAKFIDKAKCQVTPTEPAMMESLQLINDWAKELDPHKVQAFLDTYQPANSPPSQTAFFTGHLAMELTGDWELSSLQKYAPNLHYGITYVPVMSGKTPFTWAGGFSTVMPTNAHNPQGAYRFMRFMTGPDGQRIYTKVTTHLPTYKSLLTDDSLFDTNHRFFTKMLSDAHSRPPMPVWSQLWDEFNTASDKVRLGEATPQQALQSVYDRVQPQLVQYCPLR